MKKLLPVLICVALFSLHFKNAYAQPANDLCSSPTQLTSYSTCTNQTGSTLNATQSMAGTCAGTGDDDVWYRFVAQATSHTVRVQGFGGFDAVLDIRNAPACTASNIMCVDNTLANGIETANLTGLVVGASYIIRVYHYGTGDAGGDFDICVTHTAPSAPSNDVCSSAISLTSSLSCNYTSGTTTGATQSLTGTCTGNGDDDVWYSFTAAATSETVTVDGATGFDAVIDVRSGSCTGTNIMCADNTSDGGVETANLTGLTIGTTYLVRVYHFGTGSGTGSFQICVTHTGPSAPSNDVCTSAISLTSSVTCNYTSGTTTGATQSITGTCTGNGDDDVWYSFTAAATSETVKVQSGTGFDAVVDVRSGSCTGTNIMCTDATVAGGLETTNLTGLTVGATYLVRVYNYGAGSGTGNFQICVTHVGSSSPANDLCSSPTSLTSSTTCNYTSGSTTGATLSFAGTCTGNGDDDVWYSFTAVSTSHTVKVQGATGFDAVVDIRSNTSCTGTNIMCTDASGDAGLETANLTGLTVGSTYLIRVYHYGAGSGTGNFQICVTHVGSSAPANDACASAISLTSSLTCSYTSGSTTGATQSLAGTCTGTGDDDVWYSFTAVATSHTVKVQGATGFDAVVDVRSGACTGTNILCTDASSDAGLETANLTGLTVGATYFVRVYHYGAGSGTGNFQICVTHTTPSAPANDACANAISLTSSLTCSYTSGSTTGATQSMPGTCTGNGDDDVWYSFTAVATSHAVKVQSGANFDAVIDVRSGSCTGTNVMCSDVSGVAGLETANLTGLTVGATYLVRVYNYAAGAGSGSFQICVTHTTTACTYTISPTSLSYSSAAGSGSVNVTAGSSCNWTATANSPWISITSGSSGTGNGTVNYSVSSNTGSSQRTGTITIAGQTHTVAQNGNTTCTFTIAPLNLSYSSAAGSGSVNVTAASGCSWAATANDSWITVTTGSTGSGNGTVTYSVSANTGSTTRTGTITIAGQLHSVTQSATTACSYTISPTALSYTSSGGSGTVNVTSTSGCAWTAVSNSSWITITSGSSGSGSGTANYTVAANTSTTQLTGTITVAGQTHSVTQSGINCSYTIAPTALSFTSPAGTGTINVTSSTGCNWTAATSDSWITITSGSSGSGNGSVSYSVSANTGSAQRLGSILAGGQTHTVVQSGTSTCAYTITPATLSVSSSANTGSVAVATSSGCTWTAISNDAWIFVSSGNTGSGNGTVNYSVTANTTTTQRVGTIAIGGQIYTVTQAGVVCPQAPVVQSAGCSLATSQINNVSYQWYISGTPIIGATSQFYTATQAGYYSVYVTDLGNGCVVASQPTYSSCSPAGIDELNLADAIVIYPNPSSGNFSIKTSDVFKDEKITISIMNMYGQEIYLSSTTPVNGEISVSLDKVNPAKGAYTVLFRSGKTKIIKRMMIQ